MADFSNEVANQAITLANLFAGHFKFVQSDEIERYKKTLAFHLTDSNGVTISFRRSVSTDKNTPDLYSLFKHTGSSHLLGNDFFYAIKLVKTDHL